MSDTARTVSLVVGGGGFLGRAVVRALESDGDEVLVPRVPWHDQDAAATVLVDAVTALRSQDQPWRLVWCAGTGIVATDDSTFAAEDALLARVLDPANTGSPSGSPHAQGTVFFASSAGATYAGSEHPPFDETTEPRPLAPYGHSRLRVEDRFRSWAAAVGARLLVGRIANLYGPGANLAKPQGLVSQLAFAHVEGRPSTVYVPLTTTRDYLYIDDAAAMIAEGLDRLGELPGDGPTTKVFASQQGRTISDVIAAVEQAFGEPLDVRTGEHTSAALQAPDLQFRSTVLTELDDRTLTAFDDGVRRTVEDIRTA